MVTAEKFTPKKLKILNKVVSLCAKGMSKRGIDAKLGVDRSTIRYDFVSSYNVTFDYANKVSQDVLKHKLTYLDVKSKYGRKGLTALWHFHVLLEQNRYLKLGTKVKDFREKGLSFGEIGKKLNLSYTSTNMAYRKLMNVTRTGNVHCDKGEKLAKKVLSLYAEGKTIKEIAKTVKRTEAHIRSTLREKFGIAIKPTKYNLTDADLGKLHKLRGKLSWAELAYVFSVPRQSLQYQYSRYLAERRHTNAKEKK